MRFVNLIYKKINKKAFFIAFLLFLFFVVAGNFVFAQDQTEVPDPGLNWVQEGLLIALAKIIYVPVWIIGLLIGQIMGFFISAAQYNGFIGDAPVLVGWEIIRDLCNMGFIIVLLIIAIGSILRIESYSYRNWLPKLVIMAVLINFSKAICGIVIDVSQIVMLTFVSGIVEIGMGNFAEILGLKDFLNFSEYKEEISNVGGGEGQISALSIAGTMILALVFSIIALVVIAAITLVLVIRIAALWILVILSPFAFLFSASPAGQKYASQWVQNFTKWVFTGPVLAFFIWLSFKTVQGTSNAIFHPEGNILETSGVQVGLASIGSAEVMGTFILAIVMLMASLIVAQQLGGMAATVAGGAYRSITSRGDKVVKGTWGGIKGSVDWVNKKQAGGFKAFGHKFKGTGQDLHAGRRWDLIKSGRKDAEQDDLSNIQNRASELAKKRGLAGYVLGSGSRDFYEQRVTGFLGLKGLSHAIKTTFKTPEEYGKEKDEHIKEKDKIEKVIENLEEDKKGIVSRSDYTQGIKDLNEEETESTIKMDGYTKALANLVNEIKDLNNIKKEANKEGIVDYKGEKLTEDELDEILQQKNKEKTKVTNGLRGEKDAFNHIQKERDKFNTRLKNKEILSGYQAKERREIIDERIGKFEKDAEKASEKAMRAENMQAKFIIDDYEGKKERKARYRKEEQDAPENSDESILMFRNAVQMHDKDKGAGIALKLAKNLDTNEVLEAFKYNTSIGLTEDEFKKLKAQGKESEIEARKGLHDFMRDIFRDQLGMSEQLVYELEAELGGIHKVTGQIAYADAVAVKNGKYVQNDRNAQQFLAGIHLKKQDAETTARRGTRFSFGGERISDGKFIVHEAGLDWVLGNYSAIEKQITIGRFNPMNAVKLAEEENMKILTRAADRLKGENRESYLETMKNLRKFAEKVRGTEQDFGSQIKDMSDVIDEIRSDIK